jgi:hypothetical protein
MKISVNENVNTLYYRELADFNKDYLDILTCYHDYVELH